MGMQLGGRFAAPGGGKTPGKSGRQFDTNFSMCFDFEIANLLSHWLPVLISELAPTEKAPAERRPGL